MRQYIRFTVKVFSAQFAAVTVTFIQGPHTLCRSSFANTRYPWFPFQLEHVTAGMRSGDRGVCGLAADRFMETKATRAAATIRS
jgi:hypothetical protein